MDLLLRRVRVWQLYYKVLCLSAETGAAEHTRDPTLILIYRASLSEELTCIKYTWFVYFDPSYHHAISSVATQIEWFTLLKKKKETFVLYLIKIYSVIRAKFLIL